MQLRRIFVSALFRLLFLIYALGVLGACADLSDNSLKVVDGKSNGRSQAGNEFDPKTNQQNQVDNESLLSVGFDLLGIHTYAGKETTLTFLFEANRSLETKENFELIFNVRKYGHHLKNKPDPWSEKIVVSNGVFRAEVYCASEFFNEANTEDSEFLMSKGCQEYILFVDVFTGEPSEETRDFQVIWLYGYSELENKYSTVLATLNDKENWKGQKPYLEVLLEWRQRYNDPSSDKTKMEKNKVSIFDSLNTIQ